MWGKSKLYLVIVLSTQTGNLPSKTNMFFSKSHHVDERKHMDWKPYKIISTYKNYKHTTSTNNYKHSPFMNNFAILSHLFPTQNSIQATFFCRCPTSTTSSNAFGNVFIHVLRGGCVVSTMLPVPSSLRSTSIRCSCPATSSSSRTTLMRLSPKSKTAFVFFVSFWWSWWYALWSKKIRGNLGQSNK